MLMAATKEAGAEVNGQMPLRNSKIFCRYSLAFNAVELLSQFPIFEKSFFRVIEGFEKTWKNFNFIK